VGLIRCLVANGSFWIVSFGACAAVQLESVLTAG
jgi:hypothetical protein